nr:glycosyltransferase [Ornithinimicrobium sp. F0845]
MSAFRPGPALLTALRSLVEQTWDNLEILVVDDASGPEYAAVLDRAEALDPRIRVIRKAVNGGTYRARNTAMRQASGDFLTVLDSDDWLHPQAIEVGVRWMLERPGVMATICQGVRVSEDLELNRPGYVPRVTSAPSMMVRVHPVVDRIGYFDPTRKSADTEFARRIEAAFGEHSVARLPVVVTFLRGGDTLSAGEFSRGWRHGARHAYKCAYRPWHERIRAGEEDPFLDPAQPRRFPEPRRWVTPIAPDLGPLTHIDLCLAGDWRRWGGPQRSMIEEIHAARSAGLRVAVMHLEAFRFMTTRDDPLCEAVTELVSAGVVEWIHHDDDVDIDVLMIRYPPILQHPPARGRQTVRARHVLIMANQAPLEPDGSDQRYVVTDVTERTRELFGREPRWVPQGPGIRRVLREQDPDVRLTEWDNPGLIDVDRWTTGAHRLPEPGTRPVVVGRYSRDNIIKFAPSLEQIRTGYEFGPGYEVRMMGAVNTLSKLLVQQELTRADLPDNWVLLRHKQVEVTDFLAGLDFFLYLDNPHMFEAFGRTLLEAAASGVLTIAHPKHEPSFGDTIDYALPGEAQALIARYVADPGQYAERVASSRARVQERFGHHAFVQRLRGLVGTGSDGEPAPAASGGDSAGTGWRVRTESIRSAADAGRADRLSVVHLAGAEDPAAAWWAEQLQRHPGDGLPQALLDTAPAHVGALVNCRDGLVHLAARDGATGAVQALGLPKVVQERGTDRLLDLADLRVPDGWRAKAWWAGADGSVG